VSWTPRCRATALTSRATCSRRARPNALRRTASSKQSGVGCSHAPRPGIRCLGSGRSVTGEVSPASPSVAATTRSRADQLSIPRHPTQVRDGSARSPVRSATGKSTAPQRETAHRACFPAWTRPSACCRHRMRGARARYCGAHPCSSVVARLRRVRLSRGAGRPRVAGEGRPAPAGRRGRNRPARPSHRRPQRPDG